MALYEGMNFTRLQAGDFIQWYFRRGVIRVMRGQQALSTQPRRTRQTKAPEEIVLPLENRNAFIAFCDAQGHLIGLQALTKNAIDAGAYCQVEFAALVEPDHPTVKNSLDDTVKD